MGMKPANLDGLPARRFGCTLTDLGEIGTRKSVFLVSVLG